VFSLYLPTNPALPGNTPRMWELRVKHALEATGAPRGLGEELLPRLRSSTRARTAAVFAHAGATEIIDLAVDLPVIDPSTGEVEAMWGEPLLAPLHLALSGPRWAIAQVDRESARLFEVFAGEIEELATLTRATTSQLLDEPEPSKQVHPSYVPSRGGAMYDQVERRDDGWMQHFYRDVAALLSRSIGKRGIDRVAVMGPTEDTHRWMEQLDENLRARAAVQLGSLPNPRVSASEVLHHCEPAFARDQEQREVAMVDEIAGQSVIGLERCVRELSIGRLYLVAATWSLPRGSRELLVRQTALTGARLCFMSGRAAVMLSDNCGGVGGLLRGNG
jgi:hypothetical protein